MESDEIRWTAASRRHRISRQRVRDVLAHATATVDVPAPEGAAAALEERTLWLGADEHGVLLEVVTVPSDAGGVIGIHAMEMRPAYRKLL